MELSSSLRKPRREASGGCAFVATDSVADGEIGLATGCCADLRFRSSLWTSSYDSEEMAVSSVGLIAA